MGSGREVASVVGPLTLAFVAMIVSGAVSASPAATIFFQKSTRKVVAYVLPSRAKCLRLFLRDFPSGRIHQCHSGCQHVNLQGVQCHNPTKCFEDSVGRIFNRAWQSSPRNTNAVIKPYQLPLFQDFIQTDIQTLTAFLLLTVNVFRICETADSNSMLDIEVYGGIATVHLKASHLAPRNTALTKFEIERIIDGQPPFFRSTITISNSRTTHLNHPFDRTHHASISRGGWVLAAGLSTEADSVPCLYNMQQLRQKNSNKYWKGILVWSAFEMIGHTLRMIEDFEFLAALRRENVNRGMARWPRP